MAACSALLPLQRTFFSSKRHSGVVVACVPHGRQSPDSILSILGHRGPQEEDVLAMELPIPNRTVSIFWDLDNKPPTISPFLAARHLRSTAECFGRVVGMVAFANKKAFSYVPVWVHEERHEQRLAGAMELESRGFVSTEICYQCKLCGRKCKDDLHLKKHFKELHERERQKRVNRLKSLKGKKKTQLANKTSAQEFRYSNAAREIMRPPKVEYGLAGELRRAGVSVETVGSKAEAANRALKQQIKSSLDSGVIDCLCLVSDDCGFEELLREARNRSVKTILVGESRAMFRFSDAWLSWKDVISGESEIHASHAARRWNVQESLAKEIGL